MEILPRVVKAPTAGSSWGPMGPFRPPPAALSGLGGVSYCPASYPPPTSPRCLLANGLCRGGHRGPGSLVLPSSTHHLAGRGLRPRQRRGSTSCTGAFPLGIVTNVAVPARRPCPPSPSPPKGHEVLLLLTRRPLYPDVGREN
jgi:hypothetical protein